MKTGPPRFAEALLARLLPLHERNEILGDMAERYTRLAETQGRTRANLWYVRQAFAIPFRMRTRKTGLRLEFQEWRFAFRTLRKSPGFSFVAILTLALGIGANAAIFSIVYSVMLRPLPYPEPDRLVRVWEHNDTFGRLGGAWTNFIEWRADNESFAAIACYSSWTQTVLGGGEPLRASVAPVSQGFFDVMRVQPALGRGFGAEEHVEGGDPVVVVSHDFWRDQLGSAADLGELSLNVSGFSTKVIGVLPAGFEFPAGAEIWYPLELQEQATSRTSHNWRMVGRLAPGIDARQAQEDLSLITSRFDAEGEAAEYMPQRAEVVPLRSAIAGPVRSPLFLLLAASAMVVLVGCTNLASTLLARGSARAGELAVLRALGAERGRLIRRLFTESLLLAVFGAAAGLALAYTLIRALPALLPSDLPRMEEIGLHPTVALFTVLVSVAAAVLFGLLPALRVSDGDLASPLRGTRGASIARSRGPWRALVIGEVALALLLLAGAGLLLRSFVRVTNVDAGFDGDGVLTMSVALPSSKHPGAAERIAYYDALLERVRALPGVESAGMATNAPLTGYVSNGRISVDDGPEPFVNASYQVADPGYFETLRISLQRGRLFDNRDTADSGHVVVINEALAELAWPGEDPIGKRITGGGMDSYYSDPDAWATVVGVVRNVRQRDLSREGYPAFAFFYRQRADRAGGAAIVVRGEQVGAANLVGMLRDTVRDLDPDVPVRFRTMDEIVAQSLGDRRFVAEVLGAFAAMALALAALGIYGVVAYTVALRTREMGIRIALGAAPNGVVGMVLRESILTVSIGLLVGLGAALALGRVLSSQLFETSATDPLSLGVTAAILLAVSMLASFVPARRAARVDPLLAIQAE